jgi:hypothetical protein
VLYERKERIVEARLPNLLRLVRLVVALVACAAVLTGSDPLAVAAFVASTTRLLKG